MYLQTTLLVTLMLGVTQGQGPFHGGTTAYTLYNNKPPVKEVLVSNWTSTFTHANTAWTVVMYASWCGHCQRFAPKYISMATSLKRWKNVVQFAALACSHPDGEKICTDQGIIHYPTIKFFGPDSTDNIGSPYTGPVDSRESVETALVNFLSTTKPIKDKAISLTPIKSIDDIWAEGLLELNRKVLLIADNHTNTQQCLGCYVILDASNQWRRVVVRRIDAVDAVNMGIRDFPSLSLVAADGAVSTLTSGLEREGFAEYIKRDVLHLDPNDETTPVPGGTTTTSRPLPVVLPDGVHEQDLESGVYMSLWQEVRKHPRLQGQKLRAVKAHVRNMATLLAVKPEVRTWLKRVDEWLKDQTNVTSAEWTKALSDFRDEHGYIPRRVLWTGCQGSRPEKRGYPCSLWTMFHAMTVAAYEYPDIGVSGKDVLFGMRNYIIKFFSCNDCAKHFDANSKNIGTQVDGADDGTSAMLWLWRTHNKVNRRLHGDPTEDAAHPKMQFPTATRCSECHEAKPSSYFTKGDWDEVAVKEYLVDFYSSSSILKDSRPYKFIPPTVKPEKEDVVSSALKPAASLALMSLCALVTVLGLVNTKDFVL